MEYLRQRLFRETVKFLELCQSMHSRGNLGIQEYQQLTHVKLDFIKSILEENSAYVDTTLMDKIKNILVNNDYIYSISEKIVG